MMLLVIFTTLGFVGAEVSFLGIVLLWSLVAVTNTRGVQFKERKHVFWFMVWTFPVHGWLALWLINHGEVDCHGRREGWWRKSWSWHPGSKCEETRKGSAQEQFSRFGPLPIYFCQLGSTSDNFQNRLKWCHQPGTESLHTNCETLPSRALSSKWRLFSK